MSKPGHFRSAGAADLFTYLCELYLILKAIILAGKQHHAVIGCKILRASKSAFSYLDSEKRFDYHDSLILKIKFIMSCINGDGYWPRLFRLHG